MSVWTHLFDLVERACVALNKPMTLRPRSHAIRTLERGLAGVKGYAAGAIAAERGWREIRRQEARLEKWRQIIVHALAAGHEQQATQLRRLLHEHTELLGGLQVHHDAASQASASARISVHVIAVCLVEARQIQVLLQDRERQRALRGREEVAVVLHEVEQERGSQ